MGSSKFDQIRLDSYGFEKKLRKYMLSARRLNPLFILYRVCSPNSPFQFRVLTPPPGSDSTLTELDKQKMSYPPISPLNFFCYFLGICYLRSVRCVHGVQGLIIRIIQWIVGLTKHPYM